MIGFRTGRGINVLHVAGMFIIVLALSAFRSWGQFEQLADLAPGPASGLSLVNDTAAIGYFDSIVFTGFDGGNPGTYSVCLFNAENYQVSTLKSFANCPNAPRLYMSTGSEAYFSAWEPSSGYEVWETNGTESGTRRISDINPGLSGSFPYQFTWNWGYIYFIAFDGIGAGQHGAELWRIKLGETGPALVKDISPGPGSAFPLESRETEPQPAKLVSLSKILYFAASEPEHGKELWRTDGTESGTFLVKDINPGTDENGNARSSNPSHLTVVGNVLYFAADDGVRGTELWKSDGTEAGTTLVAEIGSGRAGGIAPQETFGRRWIKYGRHMYFSAIDRAHGEELWRTDGTRPGTRMVCDIRPGAASSRPQWLTSRVNGVLFAANDGVHGSELWITDGIL
ncbi:MAG: hypothetical protein K1Y02_25315, partial [Candidatus Hydrogenedentes bacterium]|nr:hypothetical protein [Candidatus Hydrogenedentota bacterium]